MTQCIFVSFSNAALAPRSTWISLWIAVEHAINRFNTLRRFVSQKLLTLFLHVTCKWYFESGHSDSWASAVSVSRFPMMPPPNVSHVTKHWIGSNFKFHTMSAITSDPSRYIEWTSNWIVSEAIHDVDDVLSITLSVDASVDLGKQLFQHWELMNEKCNSINWLIFYSRR